ncbi:MAG: ABC transporter ATP-binding protein [Candidatus Dadabacteria bacterium]|nr:MAG: ABC transporter ATP-binding protein [Candidatus Dadabacteria bacterium]
MSTHPLLELKDIHKHYTSGSRTVKALRGLSFNVNSGDYLAICGPSGCGKSTLLGIMGLLDSFDSGSYLINGEDTTSLNDMRLTALRSKFFGFVFQSFNLIERMTALENVALPLYYQRVSKTDRTERANQALSAVGLSGRATHFPGQLSGGEMQRVAIARALITSPAVLLADEPTGNLDSKTGAQVVELFENLITENLCRAFVLITHDLQLAKRATRQITLADGKIVSDSGRI